MAEKSSLSTTSSQKITPIKTRKPSEMHHTPQDTTRTTTTSAIDSNLAGRRIANVGDLHLKMFPFECLPFKSTDVLFDAVTSTNPPLYAEGKWSEASRKRKQQATDEETAAKQSQEEIQCQFINNIVDAVHSYLVASGVSLPGEPRHWSARCATKAPHSSQDEGRRVLYNRKPDGVLFPAGHEETVSRDAAEAYFELKGGKDPSGANSTDTQLAENARVTYGTQIDRRHLLGVSFVEGTIMRLQCFNRSGVAKSPSIDINEDPKTFLHIICGFAYSAASLLGRDPTITNRDGKRYVLVNKSEYEILKELHIGYSIRGRGTVCLRVKSPETGTEYIVKDSWVDINRTEKEWQLLEKGHDIDGVAHLVDRWDVVVDGKNDTTEAFTANIPEIEVRQHHRLLLKECGLPLEQFETLREFVSVLIDVIEGEYVLHCRATVLNRILLIAHRAMFEKKNVLHRDISFRNVMIRFERDVPPGKRSGLLIDFDYGVTIPRVPESSDSGVKAHRSVSHLLHSERRRLSYAPQGTLPFIAVSLLFGEELEHEARHDLESIFYVIIWACITLSGPRGQHRNIDIHSTALNEWMNGDDKLCATHKCGQIGLQITFNRLLQEFHPYFEPLKEMVRRLRENFITGLDWDNHASYESFLDILKDTRDSLPETEDSTKIYTDHFAEQLAREAARVAQDKRDIMASGESYSGILTWQNSETPLSMQIALESGRPAKRSKGDAAAKRGSSRKSGSNR
jgi:hypothetical protein